MTADVLKVWVVDDDQSVRWVLEKALRQEQMDTRSFERAEHLLEAMEYESPDVLITDVRMPGMSGIALLEEVNRRWPELPVIVITAHSDLDNAVAAYKGGAFEYLPKPFDVDEAVDLFLDGDLLCPVCPFQRGAEPLTLFIDHRIGDQFHGATADLEF